MDTFRSWGFDQNPFQSSALPSDETGRELLVGRDNEIEKVIRRIHNFPKWVTIEGPNGIGKTSLINVAIYELYDQFFNQNLTQSLFIPCEKKLQLDETTDDEEFLDQIYKEVAQTLIKRSEEIKNLGRILPEKIHVFEKWLNDPYVIMYQGTIGPIGIGSSGEHNTTSGFERSGFRRAIEGWLDSIFPNGNSGGVVIIIDNVELLETSQNGRKHIERLRDKLFSINDLRVVLCGSLGIIRSVTSTPRLEGILHSPIEIQGIDPKFTREIFEKRVKYYQVDESSYLPINSYGFERLYAVLNNNIRNTLSYADNYCLEMADNNSLPKTETEKTKCFDDWLIETSKKLYLANEAPLRPRARKLLIDIVDKGGGSFSPSDFAEFGFNSIPALRRPVAELEAVALLISTKEDSDNRKKTIQLTPKAFFIANYIRENNLTGSAKLPKYAPR